MKFKNVIEYKKFSLPLTDEEIRHIESEVKYEGYLRKQEKEIERILKIDSVRLPDKIEFKKIPGLTREAIEKLEKFKPQTIGETKKIPGITPAAIFNIHLYLSLQKKKKKDKQEMFHVKH
jgi:tRNA uridine 5-carboxymethylaminomethyl modification enzyme